MLRYPEINTTRGRKSPGGRTLWCGPFAVAQITGLGYDEAYAKTLADIRRATMAHWIKRYGKERAERMKRAGNLPNVIKGTFEHQIIRVLGKLGVRAKLTYCGRMADRPTLITFARDHTVRGRTYIVVAGNHWVTIKDGLLYHSHHDPLPIEQAKRYRMARVECWAEVKPRPAAIPEPAPLAEAA